MQVVIDYRLQIAWKSFISIYFLSFFVNCDAGRSPERGVPGTNYSLARTAYLGKPGLHLADDLGVNVTDDVLFVVFGEPEQLMGDRPSDDTSALCIYSLKSIEAMLLEL